MHTLKFKIIENSKLLSNAASSTAVRKGKGLPTQEQRITERTKGSEAPLKHEETERNNSKRC